MYRKLRPPTLTTEGIIGILSAGTFLFLLVFSFKLAMGFGALICLGAFSVTGIVLLRTRNMYFLSLLTGQFCGSIILAFAALTNIKEQLHIIIPVAVLMGTSFTLAIIFTIQRKMKWRTREMLELAAHPVKDKTNGLTHRPMQAGKMEYSPAEIRDFASFIMKRLIAIPVFENNRVVFILNIPFGSLLRFSRKYEGRTWVAFNYDGYVTVNIAQQDYYMYRDQWAFDKLCQSLGELFMNFMHRYAKGEEAMIIYRLNALNLNIITEG